VGPSTIVYDISNTSAVAEIFMFATDVASFLRFPARYTTTLTGVLDPLHSGQNRRNIRNP
jgi:hypothetical protein